MPIAHKLKSGSWRCQVLSHYEVRNGRRVAVRRSFTVSDPSRAGKKECERIAAEWAATQKGRRTVQEVMEEYIDAKYGVLSPSTIAGYRKYIDGNAYDAIKGLYLDDLTPMVLQRWISALCADKSPKYIKNTWMLFAASLRLAGRDVPAIRLPAPSRHRCFVPDDEQVRRLLDHTAGNYELHLAIMLAAFGSLRRSEICALSLSDVNGTAIHVHRAMVRDEFGCWVVKGTKTPDSDREAVVPTFVAEYIRRDRDRVVDLNPDALSNRFTRAVRFAGLPKAFTIHALRRYFVSAAHSINVPDAYLQKMGGWKTPMVMRNSYLATLSSAERREQARLHDHFAGAMHMGLHTPPDSARDMPAEGRVQVPPSPAHSSALDMTTEAARRHSTGV